MNSLPPSFGGTPKQSKMRNRILQVILVAMFFAAVSGLTAWWVGAYLIDRRLIKPNGSIDDDAAIINMGIAFIGAAIGFVTGVLVAWRFIR